jgi:SsrA-binding protein
MSTKKKDTTGGIAIVAENRKARHDFHILDSIEAGISLLGSEVKAIRAGQINLKESFVRAKKGELFLLGCHITPYAFARKDEIEPTRERKLLLHKREIERLAVEIAKKGLTIVPLKAYFRGGRCKIELGLAKGKQVHDKRQDERKREADREIARAVQTRNKRSL